MACLQSYNNSFAWQKLQFISLRGEYPTAEGELDKAAISRELA
jgi:hypothetical protein